VPHTKFGSNIYLSVSDRMKCDDNYSSGSYDLSEHMSNMSRNPGPSTKTGL